MEGLGIFVSIIGVAIAYMTYVKTFKKPPPVFESSEPKSAKENLMAHFTMTQTLSEDVQLLLEKYINQNDAGNVDMFPNITYQKYLDTLKAEHEKCLSDSLYTDVQNLKLTQENIDSMQKSISAQSEALLQIKNQFLLMVH
jgi:hypothetical protein